MAKRTPNQPKRTGIPDGWGNQTALARFLGVSHTAVKKARDEGRISKPNARGWYELEKAKREWAANTVGSSPAKPQLDDFREIPIDPKTNEPDWNVFPTSQRLHQRHSWLKGKALEQRLEREAGLWVRKSRVRQTLVDHGRERGQDLLNLVPRLSHQLAKKDVHAIEVILNGEFNALLSKPVIDVDFEVVESAT